MNFLIHPNSKGSIRWLKIDAKYFFFLFIFSNNRKNWFVDWNAEYEQTTYAKLESEVIDRD